MPEAFRQELQRRLSGAFPDGGMSGRGIVTCAGGTRLFACAYVLVRILRETLGCALPIQLWHFGGEELSPLMRRLLLRYGVELVDATAVLERFPADIRDGWQLKAYAIAHSRFEEVLFLDADQVPVRDPADLFDMPQYRQAGAVFWPDIVDLRADNPIWDWVGLAGETCRSWESGQVLIDKRRCWAALQAAILLNERADVVYGMLYGDKDTFLVAWRLAGAAVAVAPHLPFSDHRVLVQRDFDGAPLFQHRTNSKWSYHDTQYELAGFVHMDACLGYLEDLRAAWNGRLFFPPDRSPAARLEEARLESLSGLRLTLLGDQETDLQLMEGHQIGHGRSIDRQNWYVVSTEAGLELHIHDGDRVTYRLRPGGAGAWQGGRISDPANEARLDEGPAGEDPVQTGGGLLEALLDAAGFHASPGGDDELVSALKLLVRAEPGLLPALEGMGQGSDRLRRIADSVHAAVASQRIRPVDKSVAGEVMRGGYGAPGAAR